MSVLKIAYFGDVVGSAGRLAFAEGASRAREELGADLVIVNGENAKHGRGLHPVGFNELRAAGADGITLGDHYDDDPRILPYLKDPSEPICAPINYAEAVSGYNPGVRLETPGGVVWVIVVQGRLFMKREVTCPFDAIDGAIERIVERDPDATVLIELHAEATSEKGGVAWYGATRWPGRVALVVGTHTHVQTNDARILEGGTGAISDLGMCGASRGVIGFDAMRSIASLRGERGGLRISDEEPEARGVLVAIDQASRRAIEIQPIAYRLTPPAETP